MANVIGTLSSIQNGVFNIVRGLTELSQFLPKQLEQTWGSVDDSLIKLARNVGFNINELRNSEKEFVNSLLKIDENQKNLIQKYAFSPTEIAKQKFEYIENIGQNRLVDYDDIDTLLAIERQFENGGKLMASLNDYIPSMEKSGEFLAKAFRQSQINGTSLRRVSKEIESNLSKAQNYTFKNGINGLRMMADEAAKMNLAISNAFAFSDATQALDSTIEISSKLQVLGGQFAKLSNPLEIFYESTSSIEDLQKRIEDMYRGIGQINEKGEVEISRYNRQIIKQSAKAMGLNADDIFKMVERDAIREKIRENLNASSFDGGDNIEKILNTARFNKNGEAVVNVVSNGSTVEKKVSDLTSDDIRNIVGDTNIEEDSLITLKDIASNVQSIKETGVAREGAKELGHLEYGLMHNVQQEITHYGIEMLKSIGDFLGSSNGRVANSINRVITDFENGLMNSLEVENFLKTESSIIADSLFTGEETDPNRRREAYNLGNGLLKYTSLLEDTSATLLDVSKSMNTNVLGTESWGKVSAGWDTVTKIYNLLVGNIQNGVQLGGAVVDVVNPNRYTGGIINVAHAFGGAVTPATPSARELVRNGGFTNDYYNNLGPIVDTQWGPERMLTANVAGGNSIGTNEYVLSSKALTNMGDGNIEKGVQKADLINFGGVKPFAQGGDIEIRETPISHYEGGAMTSNSSVNASGNINVSMPNLGGRITVALEGTNKNKEFDINANADAILNAIIPKLNSHIQRVFLNGPGEGEKHNNDERWIG